MANTVRMTITVPRDLKARIDAVEESVNWSAVAARAYEQTLADLISRRGVRQMEDVVNRLRASKQKRDSAQFQVGFGYGKAWAEQHAEADELMRLDSIDAQSWDDWFGEPDSRSAYGADEHFVFLIQPDNHGDRGASRAFWEQVLDRYEWESQSGDRELIRGFAEGAHKVWLDVRDQL